MTSIPLDRRTAALAIAAVLTLAFAIDAGASRAPGRAEYRAIRHAAMRDCNRHQDVPGYDCRWRGGVKISTIDPRYAWASVAGPAYDNSGILRRPSRRSQRWHMVRVVGGGAQSCAHWYAKAPRPVVHEFRVRGFWRNSGNFEYHRC